MQRVLAWLFGTIVFLCMAAAITLGVLIYLVDPNIFKADIEKLAAEQGMSLDISGPLSWKLYPDIQILGSNIILASPTTSAKPLMRLEKAMLVVALKPLLKKQLAIKGLRFDGVDISLRVDENGRGNWQDIGPSNNTSAPKKADDNANSETIAIAIRSLQINNANISYENTQTEQLAQLARLNLSGDDIEFGAASFPIAITSTANYQAPQQSLNANIKIDGALLISADFKRFAIKNSVIELQASSNNKTTNSKIDTAVTLDASVELGEELNWAIQQLSIADGELKTQQAGGMSLELIGINLNTSIQPGATEQASTLSTAYRYRNGSDIAANGKLSLDGKITIDETRQNYAVHGLTLRANVGGETIDATTDISAALSPLRYQGNIKTAAFNLRKIAELTNIKFGDMSNPKALSRISVAGKFSGDGAQLNFHEFAIGLDDTKILGSATLSISNQRQHQINVELDHINIDHYLAAVSKTAPTPSPKPASDKVAQTLPLNAFNELNLNAQLSIEELTASNLPFRYLALTLNARKGLITLAPASGLIHDRPFSVDLTLDARTQPAELKLVSNGEKLPLSKILSDLDMQQRLSGVSDIKIDLRGQGNTIPALKSSLNGSIELIAQELQIANINLEKSYCQLVAALQKETLPQIAWTPYTNIQNTQTRIVIKDGVARIQQLNSGLAKLGLTGDGKVDLGSDTFDVVLKARLNQLQDNGIACDIHNDKLLNRDIPIRCKGNFASINAGSCLPDLRVIEDIAKEKAKTKLKERADKLIDKKLGSENGEAAKQIFNKYFKK